MSSSAMVLPDCNHPVIAPPNQERHSSGPSSASPARRGRLARGAYFQDVWPRRHPGDDRQPYRLTRDIRGAGFRTADAIAMKLGMTRDAPQRVRGGISFALQEATDEGEATSR